MNRIIKTALLLSPVVTVVAGIGIYFGLSTSGNVAKQPKPLKKETAPNVPDNSSKDNKPEAPPGLNIEIKDNSQTEKNPLWLHVFPSINQEFYYRYLRLVDGKPIITDDLIAHVVNDVLVKMQYTDGDVSWEYSFKDDTLKNDVTISFILKPTGRGILKDVVNKSYHIVVSKQD